MNIKRFFSNLSFALLVLCQTTLAMQPAIPTKKGVTITLAPQLRKHLEIDPVISNIMHGHSDELLEQLEYCRNSMDILIRHRFPCHPKDAINTIRLMGLYQKELKTYTGLPISNETIGALYQLQECSCFPLDRIIYPEIRTSFEDELIESIENQYTDKNQELIFLSIGSGGLFQEFVLLSKLTAKGYKNIKIKLIDVAYPSGLNGKNNFKISVNCFYSQFLNWLEELKTRFGLIYSVTTFKTMEDFLSNHENKSSVDAVICVDLDQPQANGLTLPADFDRLKSLKFVLLSSFLNCLKPNGVFGFLEKDIFPMELERLFGSPVKHKELTSRSTAGKVGHIFSCIGIKRVPA